MPARAEPGRERGDLHVALQVFPEQFGVLRLLPAVLVDRDEERIERREVHQQVVDDDFDRSEMALQFVAQHHAVHAAERMVRSEQVASFARQLFEPDRPVTDTHIRQRRADERDRFEVRISLQNTVDFVLVDRAFQIGHYEAR